MNSAPLLLLPLAAVALLSGRLSKDPANAHPEADQIGAVLDQPEFRALLDQLQQAASSLEPPEGQDQGMHSGRRRSRAPRYEQGLHSGNLSVAEGHHSGARGLTREDEWQQLFPRYSLKLAAAQ
jgi:hypothetical protein